MSRQTPKIPIFGLAVWIGGCSEPISPSPCHYLYTNFHWIATNSTDRPYRLVYDSSLVCNK